MTRRRMLLTGVSFAGLAAALRFLGLRSAEPAVVQAAVAAAAGAPTPALTQQLIALLGTKAVRKPAADALVQLGEAALPLLTDALVHEPDARHLPYLAGVCARLATPAARQLLVRVAQAENLPGRAAALRALSHFTPVPTEAPLFHRLIEEELRLAQHLVHGVGAADAELASALRYEVHACWQRLFGLLLQVYERQPLLAARRGAAHPADRQCGGPGSARDHDRGGHLRRWCGDGR